ncbi:MAG TPA: dTDP-4-dehydrorhamnose 3,5-epimerase [Alphaproteobacteria bacterium]|nr:dTDP-4-dehydrorhamnose 3,5-epimerase [Alphaproteobacteria bacterium]
MKFIATPLDGAFVIEPELREDERGFFARSWCRDEFAAHGIETALAQCNISFNRRRGTLRGLHFQLEPHGEAKLVRCTQGGAFDVIVDLRPGSNSFGRWFSAHLTAGNRRMVYAPAGFAHGFQALADETELFYQMSAPYHAASARGIRWNDPELGIPWPLRETIISPRDRTLPTLAELELLEKAGVGARSRAPMAAETAPCP